MLNWFFCFLSWSSFLSWTWSFRDILSSYNIRWGLFWNFEIRNWSCCLLSVVRKPRWRLNLLLCLLLAARRLGRLEKSSGCILNFLNRMCLWFTLIGGRTLSFHVTASCYFFNLFLLRVRGNVCCRYLWTGHSRFWALVMKEIWCLTRTFGRSLLERRFFNWFIMLLFFWFGSYWWLSEHWPPLIAWSCCISSCLVETALTRLLWLSLTRYIAAFLYPTIAIVTVYITLASCICFGSL